MSKLTPRQNDLISDVLALIALYSQPDAPDALKTLRRALSDGLSSELESISAARKQRLNQELNEATIRCLAFLQSESLKSKPLV